MKIDIEGKEAAAIWPGPVQFPAWHRAWTVPSLLSNGSGSPPDLLRRRLRTVGRRGPQVGRGRRGGVAVIPPHSRNDVAVGIHALLIGDIVPALRLISIILALVRTCGRPDESPGYSAKRRRSEEHTSELQSPLNLVCRLL